MSVSFLDHIRELEDPRIPGMVLYPLDEVLLTVLVGLLCRAEDVDEIEDLCDELVDWLRRFLPFEHGIAPAQTLRRTLARLDPRRLEEAFAAWTARLKIVDPACGSGHFLLAAARRVAAEIARIEAGSDTPDEPARQHALREVVQHCIYGVDRNPLAVELCRTALWIETVEPGKPLTFLDPHIQCGDSLVGIFDAAIMADGIPDDAYKELTGDDKPVCRDLKKRNRASGSGVQGTLFDRDSLRTIAVATAALDEMPEETLEDIETKRAAWEAAKSDASRKQAELKADLFVGAFFAPKTHETFERVPVSEDLNRVSRGMAMRPGVEAFSRELARKHLFFHWHLAFAEVIEKGGFDVVLGNPPCAKTCTRYLTDPPFPEFFYGPPYSLYVVEIDTRDTRFEAFDFADNLITLGAALRTGNLGIICAYDGGVHREYRLHRFQHLTCEKLHPIQFGELAARIFYDHTVLHEDALRVQYYWNKDLNAVIAQAQNPRSFDPFLAENHDPKRLATFIGRGTYADPKKILHEGGRIFTCLEDREGQFLRYAVTEEEIEAARRDPHQISIGPLESRWRTDAGSR